MQLSLLISAIFAFTALVNPIQKVFVVFSLREQFTANELKHIVTKASFTAMWVLGLFFFAGEAVLQYVFNLKLYSFQITCGVVLFYNGFIGLQKGFFMATDKSVKQQEIIAVPFAIPMIAGPATITATVTMPVVYGKLVSAIAIFTTLLINLIVMRNASRIGQVLTKYNMLMPLIRITGLIVAAIGVQMVLNGISTFVASA